MTPNSRDTRSAVWAATVAAAAMIAYQVGAKATRDAFFLSVYPVTMLPAMMAATSVAAIALAYGSTRALTAWGPARVIPAGFAASAALLLLEWLVSFPLPRLAAILVYLHYGCLGALLVSGFWSSVNERFDPRTARRQLGGITAGGTVGGLCGGLIAAQVGRVLPITTMIPFLAVFHLVAAAAVIRLRPAGQPLPSFRRDEPVGRWGFRALARTPYLRGLFTLVLLVTASEGLLDLVLKGRAATAFGGGGELLQFFAAFYTGVAFLTIVVQAAASRFALNRLGPARTAAVLPAGVAVVATGAIATPGLTSAVVARGIESVVSNSLYRAGYEVLFTPVPAREKRGVKALADVGASRLGDVVAAALAQAALLVAMPVQGSALLSAAVILSLAAIGVAYRLHGGYVHTLARGLRERAVQLDLSGVHDSATQSAVELSQIFRIPASGRTPTPRPGARRDDPASEAPMDPKAQEEQRELARIRRLHSRDPERVLRELRGEPLPPPIVPHVVPLLAWDDVARDAIEALRRFGPEATEHLVSFLVDPTTEFAARRRIPLVLATYRDRRAVEGLLRGLEDRRFEVRYRCGRGLAHLLDLDPGLAVPREAAFEAVLREVKVGGRLWDRRPLEDALDDEGWSPVLDDALRDRANRSLEHVFTLLALVLPRQPLRVAFKGLHTDDPLLRGTALEYLEISLPPEIRKTLWPHLDDTRSRRPVESRPAERVLRDLLESSDSILLNLDELRKASTTPPGRPRTGSAPDSRPRERPDPPA